MLGETDTLTYAGSTANVTVDLANSTASGFSAISGIENAVGGSGNDILSDAAGVTNVLTGGAGDDTFFFHETADRASEAANARVDTVNAHANTFTRSANVENLIFVGTGNFAGTGNGADNRIVGGSGADVLNGAGGNDVLEGGVGADVMNGGAGNDVIDGGAGNDTLTGGSGADTFVFRPGFGNDSITDFDANPNGGQDLIDITAFGISSAAEFGVRVAITDIGAAYAGDVEAIRKRSCSRV